MAIDKIVRRTKADIVYEALQSAIMSGTMLPGAHLRQEELAERTGKSRSCVLREAIAAYDAALCQPRKFASIGSFDNPNFSYADTPRRERLKGFGE